MHFKKKILNMKIALKLKRFHDENGFKKKFRITAK